MTIFSGGAPINIAGGVREFAQGQPDVPAVIDGDRTFTYAQLDERANRLANVLVASGLPVGTTFSFSLDQVASVTLTFRHSEQGRRVSGTCVASTHGNAGKPKCTRVVAAGSLRLRADAGANKLRFEGRISPSRKLGPGRYTVLFAATSAAGKSSPPQSRSFTIAAP